MVVLVVVGFVAGFLAGISPCILPVLPIVLVAGSAPAAESTGPAVSTPRAGLARPLAVIAGLVLSFSLVVLAGSEILSLLHLPQDSLRDAGIVLLAPCSRRARRRTERSGCMPPRESRLMTSPSADPEEPQPLNDA
jgi:cytochrome c biogenesis protein CcdA